MELVSGSYSKGQNLYHLEWCPKYRYNMFRGKGNKKLCEDILYEVAERQNIGIMELSVMPDHVHIVLQLPSTMSVSQVLHLLKGASSYELFRPAIYGGEQSHKFIIFTVIRKLSCF